MKKSVSSFKYNETTGIKFIWDILKNNPTSYYFGFLFWILKMLGVVIMTHNTIVFTSDSGSLGKFLRKILYIQSISTTLPFDYNLACFIIYIFISIILFSSMIIYICNCTKKNQELIEEKKSTNIQIILPKFTCLFLVLVVIFSQHILEILYLSFFNFYITEYYAGYYINSSNQQSINLIQFFQKFDKTLFLSKYFYLSLNSFFVIVINFILYYYLKFANLPFVSFDTCMKYPQNRTFRFGIVLMTNLIGFHHLDLLIPDSVNIKIILLFIALFLNILLLLSFDKFVFKNVSSVIIIMTSVLCLISSIVEITFYLFTNSNTKINETDISLIILRILCEFIISVIFTLWIFSYKTSNNLKKANEVFFRLTKGMNIEALCELLSILKNCVQHSSGQLNTVFELINYHRIKCQEDTCDCNFFKMENFYIGMRSFQNQGNLKNLSRRQKFSELFPNLILMIENEIIKTICQRQIKFNENIEDLVDLFFIHIDYVMYFKNSTQFALFLKNEYERYSDKHLLHRYYFILIKKRILKAEDEIFKFQEKNLLTVKFKDFYEYNLLNKTIHTLITKNLNKYEALLKVKKVFSEKATRQFVSENGKEMMKTCIDLYNESNDLRDLLVNKFSDHFYKNAEMCFLLYNFFILVNQKLPVEVEHSFVHISNYSDLLALETSFEEKNMKHPLILKLYNNQFNINYISQKLCDYLGFKHSYLIGKDFHQLLPEFIWGQHFVLMKKFLFMENRFVYKKETFIVDAYHNIFQVFVHAAVVPGLLENTLVLDLNPLKSQDVEEKSCLFILNSNFKIITFSTSFEENFLLNYEMLIRMNVSLTQFFGISDSIVRNSFKQELIEIESRPTEDLDKMLNLFSPVELKPILKENKLKTNSELPFDVKFKKSISLRKRRSVMKQYLQKLQVVIFENELPNEWSQRLSELESVLLKNSKKQEIRSSSPLNSNSNDSSLLEVQLRSVGNVPYYLIKHQDSEMRSRFSNELKFRFKQGLNNYFKEKILENNALSDYKLTEDVNLNISSNPDQSFKETTMANFIFKQVRSEKIFRGYSKANQISHFSDISSINQFCDRKFRPLRRYKTKYKQKETQTRIGKEIIIYFMLFLLLSVLTFLSAFNMFYTNRIIETAINIFHINLNVLQLNSLLIYGGLSIVNSCIFSGRKNNKFDDVLNIMREDLNTRGNELNIFSYRMKNYLYDTRNVVEIQEILDLLFKQETYTTISDDWKIYSRVTTLNDELDYYHYYMTNLQNKNMFKNCRISQLGVSGNSTDQADFGEKTTYYYINNVMPKMQKSMMAILLKSCSILQNYHDSAKFSLLVFNIIILFIFVSLGATIMFSIYHFNAKIKHLLLDFLRNKKHDQIFEKNLINFKNILESLDRKDGIIFDELKETIEKKKTKSKISNHASSIIYNKISKEEIENQQIITETKEIKDNKISNSELLNFNSQDKKFLNTSLNFASKLNTHETEQSQEEINFNINIVKYSNLLIFFFISIYVILIGITINSNVKDFDNILFSNRISANFVNRFPRFVELIIYYKISISLGKPNFIETKQAEYQALNSYLDVFGLSGDPQSDGFYNTLQDSEYAYIYFILKSEKYTIKNFIKKIPDLLPETNNLENMFNSEAACFSTGVYDQNYNFNKEISSEKGFLQIFSGMNQSVVDCKNHDGGINLKGFSLGLDNYISNINSFYLDFYNSFKSGNFNENKVSYFIDDYNFVQAEINGNFILKKAHNSIITTIISDMTLSYNSLAQKEYIYSSLKILIGFTFIFYFVLVVLWKLKNYFFYLRKGIKKFCMTQEVSK
jgi:hypothetical protein